MTTAEPPVLDLCDCCGGEGRIEYGHANAPYPDRTERCEHCEGTGFMLIEDAAPIEMEDLA